MVTGAVKKPVPDSAFLISMGGSDPAGHVQHNELQLVAIMKPIDPLAVQIGQSLPILGLG